MTMQAHQRNVLVDSTRFLARQLDAAKDDDVIVELDERKPIRYGQAIRFFREHGAYTVGDLRRNRIRILKRDAK